jgi:hypothetical protein
MAQERENPIHWDQHSSRFNITLIFALVVAVVGLFTAGSGFPFLVVLGLGMAAYSWFTTPRQYLLYRDSMVIIYGMPRSRVISFAEISHIELLALPLGERLRIRMISGSRLMLMMRDPGAFRGHLEDALARYHGEQSGAAYVQGAVFSREGDAPEYDEAIQWGGESEADFEEMPADDPGAASSGSYSEVEAEAQPAASESYTGRVEEPTITSGSYTETPEPDYSGEGRSAYGADVELESSPSEDDPPERPRSPY